MYRATPATIAWFDLSFPRFLKDPDDQVSFQRALNTCSRVVWNHGQSWPKSKELYRSLKPQPFGKGNTSKVDFGVTEHPITANGTRLRVVLLPFAEFPRKCGKEVDYPEKKVGCYLAHCVAPKSGASKVTDSHRRGLMFLKSDWEIVIPRDDENTEAYILRLGNGAHPRSSVNPIRATPISKARQQR